MDPNAAFQTTLVQLGAAGLLIAVLLAACRALWLELKDLHKLKNEDNKQAQAALLAQQKENQTQMAAVALAMQNIEKAISAAIETIKHTRTHGGKG